MCILNDKNNQQKKDPNEKERCIICGRTTDVQRDCHISMRKYYVEGAGQLCRKCFCEIYE